MELTTEPRGQTQPMGGRADRLDIVVPFTTHSLTQRALTEADRLAGAAGHRIRIVRVYEIPIHLTIDSAAVPLECLRGELLTFAANHDVYGELMLTRDCNQSWADLVDDNRVLVIASEKKPWRTPEERFARRMARMGHKVVLIYGEQ